MEENKKPDDGSLAFLNIPRDESNRSFNCDETTQSKLVNTSFWVCDFIEEVPTRFSKTKGTKGQTLVKIKPDKNSPEADAKKFFTGSADILYVCQEIKKRNAFPRRVTLRGNGNRYWFEYRDIKNIRLVAPVGFCSAVMRITARMRASLMRIRITPPRIRIRTSVRTYAFWIFSSGVKAWKRY